eukprot:1682281-Prymnesium_polylepis.2
MSTCEPRATAIAARNGLTAAAVSSLLPSSLAAFCSSSATSGSARGCLVSCSADEAFPHVLCGPVAAQPTTAAAQLLLKGAITHSTLTVRWTNARSQCGHTCCSAASCCGSDVCR